MDNSLPSRRAVMLGVGSAVVAAGLGSRSAAAQTPGAFKPATHPEDAWLDQRPGTHRIVIDAATADAAGAAMLYANNLCTANKSAYAGGADTDLALVVVLRHFATAFAFTDAMWAKYGKAMSAAVAFTDPRTKEAPSTNLYNATGYGLSLTNLGATISAVTRRGAYFAVCDTASHFLASQIASATKGDPAAIYKELTLNLIPNSRIIPNGVMAVTRSQEHGYSLVYAG